jgi:hypothetical protein
MKKKIIMLCFMLCGACFIRPVLADSVTLKNGQVIEGKIIESNDKYTKINFNNAELVYFQEEIASVNRIAYAEKAIKQQTVASPNKKNVQQPEESKNINPPAADVRMEFEKSLGGLPGLSKTGTAGSRQLGIADLQKITGIDYSKYPPKYLEMMEKAFEKVQTDPPKAKK